MTHWRPSFWTIDMESKITMYADGACSGNPGPGGYGIIVESNGQSTELWGCAAYTTNNKMELKAVIEGLKSILHPSKITVITDSQYVVKGITEWIHNWIAKGWRTSSRKPVANKEMWITLFGLNGVHDITWKWIKGHNGHPQNERCDTLATEAIKGVGKSFTEIQN